MERLQKVIANCGFCSRRKAEELIVEGRVIVDGDVVVKLGTMVSNKSVIEIDGIRLEPETKVYYLFNKPRGIVTTTKDDKGRKSVVDFITTEHRIYPVGRLDYDTTGLLILTNDGEFSNLMMHPKNKIEKVYVAKVNGIVKGEDVARLKAGVEIEKGIVVKASRVKLRKVNQERKNSLIEITIYDGKNHQVKKMFQSLGLQVDKLKRERIGFLTLGNLQSGEYRELTKKEVHQLYALANRVHHR
ncbi:MAG: pseudouridine synthase [bacterium]|nr:pseudouridine synthase [bacterium]